MTIMIKKDTKLKKDAKIKKRCNDKKRIFLKDAKLKR